MTPNASSSRAHSGRGGSIPEALFRETPQSIPNKIQPSTAASFPPKIFFIKPVSQQLSAKQPPGQLLLQGTTPLSLSLPWTSVPSHPSPPHFHHSREDSFPSFPVPTRICPCCPIPVPPSLAHETQLVQNLSMQQQAVLPKAKPRGEALDEAGASVIPSAAVPLARHTRPCHPRRAGADPLGLGVTQFTCFAKIKHKMNSLSHPLGLTRALPGGWWLKQ